MCGLLGIIAAPGATVSLSDERIIAMRDQMTCRGPDGAGLVRERNVVFAHRRLAVMDPARGEQPWWSPDRRFLVLYNGEIYNDLELRRELERDHGALFRTRCDTETVVLAYANWGVNAFRRLRGMFAIAVYDFQLNVLTLARDPFGMKPLYLTQAPGRGVGAPGEVVIGSHLPALLSHPSAAARPNLRVISSFLTTLRTTLGNETLFDGVMTLRPGEFAQVQREGERWAVKTLEYWREPIDAQINLSFDEAATAVRAAVTDSIGRHLRSDVPVCVLMSGGIDSAIIGAVCRELGSDAIMNTWCAGAANTSHQTHAGAGEGAENGDLFHARLMAARLGTTHHEVIVDESVFDANWRELTKANGLPLSTPNETAILAVARDLKSHATVAISGEGADELFGGYAGPVLSGLDRLRAQSPLPGWPGTSADHYRYRTELVAQYGTSDFGGDVEHYLRCNSWIHPGAKRSLLSDEALTGALADEPLISELKRQFEIEPPEAVEPMERLLRVHRRINLTGLLQRLDTASMLASVEGRTPFADVAIAELAFRLPFDYKLRVVPGAGGGDGWRSAAANMGRSGAVETKRILRRAFSDLVPREILDRPKASFPLPFQSWLAPAASELRRSAFMAELLRPEAINSIAGDPQANWQTAWPVLSLTRWADTWWG